MSAKVSKAKASATKAYTVDEVNAMTKVELRELIINGAFSTSPREVLQTALDKLATKASPQKRVIVAKRIYTKDVIDRATGLVKYPKGHEVELAEKNLRNILSVQAKRLHRDEALMNAQLEAFVNDVMSGTTFHASNYKIVKV